MTTTTERVVVNPCVQCGYCCTQGPCGYGKWDPESHRCVYLTHDNCCTKYNEIVAAEQGSDYPMFGCGCSSSLFNRVRDAKIRGGGGSGAC
jgi:hypothetical protein